MKEIKKISAKWSAQPQTDISYKLISFDIDENGLPYDVVWDTPDGIQVKTNTGNDGSLIGEIISKNKEER